MRWSWAAIAAAVAGAALVIVALATAGSDAGRGVPPRTAATAEPAGLAVFREHGCGSCHAFAPAGATGTMAPDLSLSLAGKPPAFVRESIVDPAAAAEPEWGGGMMPDDYGERIPPRELDALVAFLTAPRR